MTAPSIPAERITLRKARDDDAAGLLETQVDHRVRQYLGGPRPEHEVRAAMELVGAAALLSSAGCYVVSHNVSDELLGTLTLQRRGPEQPGHVEEGGNELELTYVFRAHAWGQGYAEEAVRALLVCAAVELDDQPVLIVTQTANGASLRLAQRLGFTVVGTFEQWEAEQALAVARLRAFGGGDSTIGQLLF